MAPPRIIDVQLLDRSYQVVVGAGVLGQLGDSVSRLFPQCSGRVQVVADTNLPESLVASCLGSLARAGLTPACQRVVAEETGKSLATVERLVAGLASSRHERGDPVVALGGGIVGDVAGFAASIYRRGVPVVQCPTTLLAMVDASVGGKTGVNLLLPGPAGSPGALKKNMLGAFHQPSLVVCDVDALPSLTPRLLSCGLGECIKHALLAGEWGDPTLLEWTRAHVEAVRRQDPEVQVELVARNVAVKAAVVAADELERRIDNRGRMVLNMGHTVGHAIETMGCTPRLADGRDVSGEGLEHGEAVGLGLIAEAACAQRVGLARPGTVDGIRELLELAGLPVSAAGLPPADVILDAMQDDKKVGGGRLRLAAPTGSAGGGCVILESPDRAALVAGIEAVRAQERAARATPAADASTT